MVVQNHSPRVAHQTGHRIDTLVISHDHLLFKQFCAFLKEFEPDRKPLLVDRQTSLAGFEHALNQCDVMICDIRSNAASIELGAYAMECITPNTVSIGLISDNEYSRESLNPALHLRLGGIIDNRNGWFTNWHQIAAIKQAWHNPLMMSRIEEVPVADVFQMIAAGRWNSIVHIEGTAERQPSGSKNKPLCGCISFYQGEPQTAWSWRSAGIEAVYDLLGIRRGVLQVMKNLCAPTIRNVFLQTDEILLSHAVALDEAAFLHACNRQDAASMHDEPATSVVPPASSQIPVPQDEPPPVVQPTCKPVPNPASWWNANGAALCETIAGTAPQTFLLRWMTDDELRRLATDRDSNGVLLLYGAHQELSRIFLAVARGFTMEKMLQPGLFPVARIGRGKGQFLYIAGSEFTSAPTCPSSVHAAVFTRSMPSSAIELLAARRHPTLQEIAGSESGASMDKLFGGKTAFRTLTVTDFSWKSITSLLTDVISFVVAHDGEAENGVV